MEQNTVIYKKFQQNLPCMVRFPKPTKNNGTMADKHIWLNRSHVVWISIHAEEYIQVVPHLYYYFHYCYYYYHWLHYYYHYCYNYYH